MSKELGIILTLKESMSSSLKTLGKNVKAFDKTMDELERGLVDYEKSQESLVKKTADLRTQFEKAKKTVKEEKAAFNQLSTAANEAKMNKAIEEQERLEMQLKTTRAAMNENKKAFSDMASSARKSLMGAAEGGLASALQKSGLTQMLGESFSQSLAVATESALGQPMASALNGVISSVASGAAMGMLAGPGGAAVGALAGAAAGGLSAWYSVYSAQDESFKSYVQDAVEGQISAMDSTLESGSSIAGSREQTKIAMTQRFGSEAAANEYLEQVKTMAVKTNYGYDEIVGYSKLLLNTYDADKTLGVLSTLSDASAALNLSSSDVEVMIAGLSRMRTTGKATQEYLNYFSERGVDVYSALSTATGWDKSSIAGHVTAGDIKGDVAAEAILSYINETFGGLSDKLAGTYDAMVDNLADAQANIDAAMGEGYNEARKEGIQAQSDWLEGENGEALSEAYSAIGAWKASLENVKERLEREFVNEAMESDEYKTALAAGDAATAGRLIMEAKVKAQNEYNASEGAQLLLESEKSLIDSVRTDTATKDAYWNAGYEMGQEYSKGRAAGLHGA